MEGEEESKKEDGEELASDVERKSEQGAAKA